MGYIPFLQYEHLLCSYWRIQRLVKVGLKLNDRTSVEAQAAFDSRIQKIVCRIYSGRTEPVWVLEGEAWSSVDCGQSHAADWSQARDLGKRRSGEHMRLRLHSDVSCESVLPVYNTAKAILNILALRRRTPLRPAHIRDRFIYLHSPRVAAPYRT